MINVSHYACKHMDVDIDGVVTEFACLKGRRLGLRLVNLVDGVTVLPFFRLYCSLPITLVIKKKITPNYRIFLRG